ncbi:ERMES complex subunit [Cryomyces antarcticus]|nr:ERMES complex subunit [Cryomyces antarcticus]
MAFNFNWSPLIADTSRAREMLTTALNKSPKPPIIVDDIIVNELNLGSVPPELEILEIGDLAEDRFRGIFKMSYTGDAFLTLKTRVQANPLNTYLSAKPSFASPQPLAASSGLTIPLQITLSDIRLSGFVILVFSRQKGITLVFRNDPLESLKVSSTFDSIPFVRDYLQKEIEGQLRVLFMEDLPAIIHRLSLRLWVPEYQRRDEEEASPPQDPIDVNDSESSPFSLDANTETRATFSQKNLLRLAALTDSHRTLSLFTPSIRDTVFRAWPGATERGEYSGTSTPKLTLSSLSRMHSSIGSGSTAASVSEGSETGTLSSRPSLTSFPSVYGGLTMGAGRAKAHAGRKRKTRVVNLRRKKDQDVSDVDSSTENTTAPPSIAVSEAPSMPVSEEREGELNTPPRSPQNRVRFRSRGNSIDLGGDSSPHLRSNAPESREAEEEAPSPLSQATRASAAIQASPSDRKERPALQRSPATAYPREKKPSVARSSSYIQLPTTTSASYFESSGGILEQAWMMKMAAEIARKVDHEKASGNGFWDTRRAEVDDSPPPAYVG